MRLPLFENSPLGSLTIGHTTIAPMPGFAVLGSGFLEFDCAFGFLKLIFLGRDFDRCLIVPSSYNEG